MKKIINNPSDFVEESIQGLVISHPDIYSFASDNQRVIKRTNKAKNKVGIVSGGGSGVTAASVIGVARASEQAKAHFILLGRSLLIEETEGWVEWSEEQLSQRKMALREEMISQSEDGKVTMVQWNSNWQKYTRSRDVYVTINEIEKTGNKAEYQSIDVMDSKALIQLGGSIKRKITGVVHGAGLEDSKLVADKSHEIFDRVVSSLVVKYP